MIRMSAPTLFPFSRTLAAVAIGARPDVERKTRHYAMLCETQVKANASGRPGPRRVTGDYVRSITRELLSETTGHSVWIIGTNAPQARRLEFGFVGADSLGRIYNQPPYPHFGPALDMIGPQFEQALDGIITKVMAGLAVG